jgi:cytochrome c oxidase subunit 1
MYTGVGALAASGLYAILVVIARTPHLRKLLPGQDFFHVALVVHVNLAVLTWFFAVGGMLWCLEARIKSALLPATAWGLFTLATALMALSPFLGATIPSINNYIPMLLHPVFTLSLALLTAGILLQSALGVLGSHTARRDLWQSPLALAGWNARIALWISCLAFWLTASQMPAGMGAEEHYETLFWGGGHGLQLMHTSWLMLVWMLLAAPHIAWRRAHLLGLFGLNILATLTLLAGYHYPVSDPQHTEFFTQHMRILGGAAPGLMLVLLAIYAARARSTGNWQLATQRFYHSPPLACFAVSLFLFGAGGVIGLAIDGTNVRIPAHYHGAIVGMTIAFMGLTYRLLPLLRLAEARSRMARIQPWLYGLGQTLHIAGLAWSGGYGVARKTLASEDGVLAVKIALGMMGLGGLLAILGGLCFILVIWQSVRTPAHPQRS